MTQTNKYFLTDLFKKLQISTLARLGGKDLTGSGEDRSHFNLGIVAVGSG